MKKYFIFIVLIFLCAINSFAAPGDQFFFVRDRLHATDCTAITTGKAYDVCTQLSDYSQYRCMPDEGLTGTCNNASEWKALSSGWKRVSGKVYPTNLTDNVGVGTSDPNYTLHVNGGFRVEGSGVAADDGIVMDNGYGFKTGTTAGDTAVFQAYDNTNGSYTIFAELEAGTSPSMTLTDVTLDSPIITGAIPDAPRAGEFGFDSAVQNAYKSGAGTVAHPFTQYIPGIIFTQTASATVSDTTTETSLISTGVGWVSSGLFQPLPTGFFVEGKTVLVRVSGYITNTSTPTIRIRCKLGSTAVVDTTAVTTSAITGNGLFSAQFVITGRTTGGSGTVMGQGVFNYATSGTAVTPVTAANTTTTTINTATTQALDVTAQWGTASSSNTIVATNVIVEVLN